MATQESRKRRTRKKTNMLRVTWITIKWMLLFIVVFAFLCGGIACGYVTSLLKDEPVRSAQTILHQMKSTNITGFVYFNDGTEVGQLGSSDHQPTTLNEIPDIIKTALLSIENHNFYNDYGISIRGTMRAALQKLMHNSVQTGGSTITQQLVKNVFLTDDGSLQYKAKQIFLALHVERIMSKDQILLAYLNKVAFGDGNKGHYLYGVQSAAKGIFGIQNLNDLKGKTPRNIAISAYLVGLPQNPNTYSAFDGKGNFDPGGFKKAVARQRLVLLRMHELHNITDSQYQAALKYDIRNALAKPEQSAYEKYPYLMLYAEQQAAQELLKNQHPKLHPGDNGYDSTLKQIRNELETGGYKIYTTVDKSIYDSMQKIAQNPKNFSPTDKVKGDEQVGAVMLQNDTGAVLGMIPGRGYGKNQFNYAVQAYRSPGSTMKPIAAYGPAMQEGKLQPASIINDSPVILPDGRQKYFIPKNWDDYYHGLMTAREALDESYNIPAIKVFLNDVGIKNSWDNYAKKMGITSLTPQDYHSRTGVIGGLTKGVNVLQMTSAYSTFANQGVHTDAYIIAKMVNNNENVIYQHESKKTQVFSLQTSYLMTSMMKTVISKGTAWSLTKWGSFPFKDYGKIDIAGKTGSTNGNTDLWFEGYTPDVTLGVWAGYNSSKYDLTNGIRALSIWSKVMNQAVDVGSQYFKHKTFTKPDNIVSETVSGATGQLPSDLEKQTKTLQTFDTKHQKYKTYHLLNTDIFNQMYIPTQTDNALVKMNVIKYNGMYYIPQPNTPKDMQENKLLIQVKQPFDALQPQLEKALKVIPADERMSMNRYRPTDEDIIAPSSVDPRKDDGVAPDAPTNVKLTKKDKQNLITFTPSTNTDVIGYRLYQSSYNGPFNEVGVVMSGDPSQFKIDAKTNSNSMYYITAVDVGGHESNPSGFIFASGSSPSGILDLPGANGGGTNANAPDAPNNVSITTNGIGIVISWDPDPADQHVTKYSVYYSPTENGVYRKLHGGSTDKTNITVYAANYDGYYKVTAFNGTESAPSAAIPYNTNGTTDTSPKASSNNG